MSKSALVLCLIGFLCGLTTSAAEIGVCDVVSCPLLADDGAYCCDGAGPYDWANRLVGADAVGCCGWPQRALNWLQNHLLEVVLGATVLAVVLILLSILCCPCSCCTCCTCCC